MSIENDVALDEFKVNFEGLRIAGKRGIQILNSDIRQVVPSNVASAFERLPYSRIFAKPCPKGIYDPVWAEQRVQRTYAIAITREQIAREEPEAPQLAKAESTFRKVSVVLLRWLVRKTDLATHETIKAGIGVAKWSAVAALAGELAAERAKLVSYILPF